MDVVSDGEKRCGSDVVGLSASERFVGGGVGIGDVDMVMVTSPFFFWDLLEGRAGEGSARDREGEL